MEGPPLERGSTEPWRMQFFGGFRAERAGVAAKLRTKKTASLLAYLVYYQSRSVSKDLLVEALWPESDYDRGRHSLRMALASIRSALGSSSWDPALFLISERDTLEAREPGFSSDVREFKEHARSADLADSLRTESLLLRKAFDLYTGSFLQNLADEWILPQALELEEQFGQIACRLMAVCAREGDIHAAASVGRRAITIHPNREDLHVGLMSAYAACGQSASAIRQFEELERMLADQWGEEPGEDARRILDQLPRHRSVNPGEAATITPLGATTPDRAGISLVGFFGRKAELDQLRELLDPDGDGPRIVTLVGLGGSGKTRLARQIFGMMASAFHGRAWMVSLVGVEDQSQMADLILAALTSDRPKGERPLQASAELIGSAAGLIVFDNVEQLADAAAGAISYLLRSCERLRILATSRVPLEVTEEHLMPVGPLPLPTGHADLTALRESPSVQLLTVVGQAVRPGFAVTPANALSVLLLCQRLEGIPLAIELAGAKLSTLTPAQVNASLSRRIDLSSPRARVSEHHHSLRNVVDWSISRLSETEGMAFAQLGVCRGGFTHILASSLLGTDADLIVERLCRSSLVGWSETATEVRFEMLETVRELAVELLETNPVLQSETLLKHFEHFRSLCQSGSDAQTDHQLSVWAEQVGAEMGNVMAALDTASSGLISPRHAWDLALPLRQYIDRHGRPQVWLAPFDRLLKATESDLDPVTAVKAHGLLANTYYGVRDIRATYHHCRKAIASADLSGDPRLCVDSRVELANSAITIGLFEEAERALLEAIALLPAVNDATSAARCHLNLAWVTFDRGKEPESAPHFQVALELAELSHNDRTIGAALTGMGVATGHSSHIDAQPFFDRALAYWRNAGVPASLAHCLYYRSLIDYRHGELESALCNLSASMNVYVANGIALGQTVTTIAGNALHMVDWTMRQRVGGGPMLPENVTG